MNNRTWRQSVHRGWTTVDGPSPSTINVCSLLSNFLNKNSILTSLGKYIIFQLHIYVCWKWENAWSYLAMVHYHGTENNNGCQELPLIPPVWITSTNRHAHLPLEVGKVKELDWMLERSRNQVGMSIGWGYSNRGDKWQFLAAIIVHCTTVHPIWFLDLSNIQSKWACLLVEVIQTGGISGNSWQPLLFTVPR